MAYSATVIPVMIASPGDVAEERDIVRTVIHDWNDVNAQGSKLILTAVGWDTHASPELGTRPQDLINDRILKNCDLLIGVFWTRLGTPTGKAPSGTVEEIDKHVAAGKPALIYFSSKPVAPESIDHNQYALLQEVKTKWKAEGLIEFFDSAEDFRVKLTKHLPITIANNPYIQDLIDTPNVEVTTLLSPDLSYQLTEEAQALLKGAASTTDGSILKVAHNDGEFVLAGKERWGGRGRESSLWVAALEELLRFELVVAKGFKGEVYELTHKGWTVADALQSDTQ